MTWSITVTNNVKVKAAISSIPNDAWVDIDYTLSGYAQVAETTYDGGGRRKIDRRTVRLVVRRTRLADTAQARLFPEWRHHSFITNRCDLTTVEADQFHRNHAIVELAIRELKDGGATHIPSGHYPANAAWFASAVIAHNLARWAVIIGGHGPVNTRTLRTRIIAVPAVSVNRSGRRTLRFPSRWPWQDDFTTMLQNLRALPGPAGWHTAQRSNAPQNLTQRHEPSKTLETRFNTPRNRPDTLNAPPSPNTPSTSHPRGQAVDSG